MKRKREGKDGETRHHLRDGGKVLQKSDCLADGERLEFQNKTVHVEALSFGSNGNEIDSKK